ncbi:MauE/DoxX family redox-associated membrane protein [Rathayibacter sp. Leaf248]|uniref:MauE/DoxX family redox-associated membrane protein n=1 Tax=Rathayibacter sp. Leaf248 TaxID=2876555 RepID=UPI001E4E3012|nr:MauE/DoxX family redox-associated membrane protein [Rathayibacter sp. Leaf248]
MLEVLLAIAGWATGAVLVVSGALKLGRTERFRESLGALGLPAVVARGTLFARSFPVVEIVLGLAVLLAPAPLHRLALLAALAVLVVFLVVAIGAARAPEPVDCECFGGLGEARMSGRTVLRNSVLVALAVAGLAGPVPPAALAPGLPALAAVLLALVLVLVRDRLQRRAAPPSAPASTSAPAPSSGPVLLTASGDRIALAEFTEPPTHLVFFSPSCISCHELVDRFRWWPNGLRAGEDLVPVLLGRPEDFAVHEVFAPLVEHALYDPNRSVAALLGRGATPGHVLLDAEHPLGSGWSTGWYEIEKRVLSEEFFTDVHRGRVVPDPEVLAREESERAAAREESASH